MSIPSWVPKLGEDRNGSTDESALQQHNFTTSSSTTDITGQTYYAVGPEDGQYRHSDPYFHKSEQQPWHPGTDTTSKPRWALWKILALASLAFAVIIGLGIGLGVGLTQRAGRGRKSGDESSSDANGSGSGDQPHPNSKFSIYWGVKKDTVSLDTVCEDDSYDIINLSFLSYFYGVGQFPKLTIASLNGTSAAQDKAGAKDLQDGTSLMPAIQKCQANGKLVLLSMGGAKDYADVTLNSDGQGEQMADMLWNLFLGGTKQPELRPFGSAILDGLDFDNESGKSTGYQAMATRLRSYFATDSNRRYYMTAAPQCPFPTDEGELSLFRGLDYISVQFYNNNVCNLGESGFMKSVQKWSDAIGDAKLLIGGLASNADKDEGYIDAKAFGKLLDSIWALNLKNYGGVMLWEAELAKANGDYQKKLKAEL